MAQFLESDILYLVNDHGISLTLTRESGGAYNTDTGKVEGNTSSSFTFTGFLFNNTTQIFGDTSVVRGNRALVLPASSADFEPTEGDTLSGESDSLKVEGITKVFSGPLKMYLLEVSE